MLENIARVAVRHLTIIKKTKQKTKQKQTNKQKTPFWKFLNQSGTKEIFNLGRFALFTIHTIQHCIEIFLKGVDFVGLFDFKRSIFIVL